MWIRQEGIDLPETPLYSGCVSDNINENETNKCRDF